MAESESKVVEITSFKLDVIKPLLNYMYTAQIEINVDNVQSLVQACDQFDFERLKEACEQFLQDQIEPTNCIGLFRFAKLYRLNSLMESARHCMLQNFKEVLESSTEFLELSPNELIEYIADDVLCVSNEDLVVEAVILWAKASMDERIIALDRVLERVRFPFCSSTYLCHVAMKEPLLATSTKAHAMIHEAVTFHLLPDQQLTPRVRPRKSFRDDTRLVVVGGLLKDEQENKFCWYFREESASWELLAQLPRPTWKFYSACATKEGILVTGGYHCNVKKEVWFFDCMDKKWKSLAPMTTARCKHQSVLQGADVVVVGGEDDADQLLTSVEKFDSKHRQWSLQRPMQKALSDPLVVSFGHSLYVLSGIQDDDTSSSCTQEFDCTWNRWKFRSEMPEPCRLGAAVTLGDAIYVVGGFTRSSMSYRPATDTWSVLSRPRGKHGNAPAVVWRGRVLVGGGDVLLSETVSTIEDYDPATNTWSFWKVPLKEDLSCHYMLSVDLGGL
ncbi:hypothetical protein CAPTEDRAFT_136979 [Capitella teleta]|uniref:BACK domain-containing protein n=1 Tax=Capitella teleta TaxID=283909 RepID=R7V5H2_CAPTE|nr:hypothetical protein CAPTEDRAFT_136979 [Capitella teleta]|eukprot:ELU11601.1 hypothetical protein CAPTEDRAFT_136979 [Capitella teleta]